MLCYAKSLQSYPTLCNPIDGSPPGSAIPGILQARTLEWVAISFSNAWKWKVKVKLLSRVWLVATPWTAAYQAPPSMRFSSKSTGVACHCLLQQCRGDRVDEKKYWISSGKIVETDQNILVLAYMKLINKSRYIMMHVFGVTYVKAWRK